MDRTVLIELLVSFLLYLRTFDVATMFQVPMMVGINKTIEYFRNELKRIKHSERNIWHPELTLPLL